MQGQLAELVKSVAHTKTKTTYVEDNYYDIISHQYDTNYIDPTSQAENEIVKDLIISSLNDKKELRILDIGCGTGLIYEMLEDRTSSYTGIDISEGMLRQFRNKFPTRDVTLIQKDINEIDLDSLEDNSFDLIISTFGSFSYMHNPGKFIKNARKKLTTDGIFFLMTYSQLSTKNIYHSCLKKDFCMLNKYRPYSFRNDTIDISGPCAYFYTGEDLKKISAMGSFNNAKVHGLNYFIDFIKDGFKSFEDAKNSLLQEMNTYNNIDLAHSLIFILNNNE